MKRSLTKLISLLGLLILVSACGNGRSTPTLPDTTNADAVGQQANALATQAAAVITQQGEGLATEAAATLVAQTEALATQAANIIVEDNGALATQAADLIAQGEEVLQNSTIPDSIEPGSLAEKFATVPIPSGDGTVEVTITEAELNQAIAAGQAAKAQAGTPSLIQNPQVQFTGGFIVLTGTIAEPVSGPLTVSFSPYVSNGMLQFEVVEASIGNFRVPPAALQTAEQTLNSTLGAAMGQLPVGTGLQSVTVGEGSLTVVVVRI